jgi:nicotinate-nucleotide adenylyltransferase
MRIGVFGGTFDPVHLGHLILAEQCREQAALDEVLFIPAYQPPHKPNQHVMPFHHRVEMLALAVAGNPAFRIDEIEKRQGGLSYTVRTLTELRGARPGDELYFIIGSDCLPQLSTWREPVRILELANLLVAARPGAELWSAEQLRASLGMAPEQPLHLQVVEVPLIDTSSTDLRRRAAAGRTVRYLVPRAVECYIATHHLYQAGHRPEA